MKRGKTAGMARIPSLQHVEGFAAPDFPHDDAIRPQPQSRAHQIGQRHCAGPRPQRHAIPRGALQFARVFNQDDPLVACRHFGQQRIGQGGLAGAGATADQDVAPVGHGAAQHVGLQRPHDAVADIVIERVDACRGLADGEARRQRDGRQDALEAFAAFRQFGADHRIAGMDFRADVAGNQADDALHLRRFQPRARLGATFAQAVEPERAVRVHHHFDDMRIGQGRSDGPAHCRPQHAPLPVEGFGMRQAHSAAILSPAAASCRTVR